MKFLFDSLNGDSSATVWHSPKSIIMAHQFFWSSGTVLQKSVEGLCRCLIFQILEQRPDLVDCVVAKCRFTELSHHAMSLSKSRLRQALLLLIQTLDRDSGLFLCIDGLDECEHHFEEQDELLDLLLRIADLKKIRVCVASRPWDVFREAFMHRPRLRLEDLTRADIEIYVTSQLSKSRRWCSLRTQYRHEAESLVMSVIVKAEGVLLWVRLVVRDLLQAIRDGNDIDQLQQTVKAIPSELNNYFLGILHSIDPKYRREASVLIQLALFEETMYADVLPLCLADAFFMAEDKEDFGAYLNTRHRSIDLRDKQKFFLSMVPTRRKLNSRCKGLLVCDSNYLDSFEDKFDDANLADSVHRANDGPKRVFDLDRKWISKGLLLNIELLHDSLRDFFMRSDSQEFLHHHNGGRPLNARLFFRSTKAMQLLAMTSVGYYSDSAVGAASHILSSIWVDGASKATLELGKVIHESVEQLAALRDVYCRRFWYLNTCLETWTSEKSNFLSLAINFELSSYVSSFMARRAISMKTGRPLLDYILRPRFVMMG